MAHFSHITKLALYLVLLGSSSSCFGGWLDDTEVVATRYRTELPTDPLPEREGESALDMACRTVKDMYAYQPDPDDDPDYKIILEVPYPGDSPESTPRGSYSSGSSSSSTAPNAAKIFVVSGENGDREPITIFHYITTGSLEEPLKLPKIRDFPLPWKVDTTLKNVRVMSRVFLEDMVYHAEGLEGPIVQRLTHPDPTEEMVRIATVFDPTTLAPYGVFPCNKFYRGGRPLEEWQGNRGEMQFYSLKDGSTTFFSPDEHCQWLTWDRFLSPVYRPDITKERSKSDILYRQNNSGQKWTENIFGAPSYENQSHWDAVKKSERQDRAFMNRKV